MSAIFKHVAAAFGAAALGSVCAVATASGAMADHNPAGNNGVVKIGSRVLDTIPNNAPHQGCSFRVDFYNYDRGATASVSFAAIAPTTGTVTVAGNTAPAIGGDDAGGGGDLDGSQTYTLGFTGAPHDKQGYHVKVTVTATGSIGNDTKTKVFWVQGCGETEPGGGDTGGGSTGGGDTGGGSTGGGSTGGGDTGGGSTGGGSTGGGDTGGGSTGGGSTGGEGTGVPEVPPTDTVVHPEIIVTPPAVDVPAPAPGTPVVAAREQVTAVTAAPARTKAVVTQLAKAPTAKPKTGDDAGSSPAGAAVLLTAGTGLAGGLAMRRRRLTTEG